MRNIEDSEMIHNVVTSAVLAWLGLKAPALAWLEVALAFSIPRPGQSHQPQLGPAQAVALVTCPLNLSYLSAATWGPCAQPQNLMMGPQQGDFGWWEVAQTWEKVSCYLY
jgi:hypothetical protein